jgi:hypothetical protein
MVCRGPLDEGTEWREYRLAILEGDAARQRNEIPRADVRFTYETRARSSQSWRGRKWENRTICEGKARIFAEPRRVLRRGAAGVAGQDQVKPSTDGWRSEVNLDGKMQRLTWTRRIPLAVIALLLAVTMDAQSGATIAGTLHDYNNGQPIASVRLSLREYPECHGRLGRVVRVTTTGSDGAFHFLGVPPARAYAIVLDGVAGRPGRFGVVSDVREGESLRLTGGYSGFCESINFQAVRSDAGVVFRYPFRVRHNCIFICE